MLICANEMDIVISATDIACNQQTCESQSAFDFMLESIIVFYFLCDLFVLIGNYSGE